MAGRLERIEQSRRQWVADTSHELRTPLSVLRAQIEAMQDGVRQPTPENIATMLRHVLSLSKLVDELYELARADEGNFDYTMTPTALWPLIVEEAGGFADKLVQAGLTLSLGPTPARSRVLCDPDRLRQVFCNLFENSVRYTTAGGRIEVRAADAAGRLTVTVDDTAPAVPEEALARLAERFFRVEQSRNRRQGGSGLGLAMCRRIVEAHGGTLDFAHSPLGGLRVTLTFPLEQEQA
jgi:two-component system sensor histidine kinase BaeS